jgi:heterodisulfide reductase subunit A
VSKIGSVLVVGGGVAGIQSSLDLAESGFKVYLLEESPAIGGYMARLDKTFPTNDCAMCILSPKLVETSRHLNIELITYATLKGIRGEAGDFRVLIEKKPRYVDPTRCSGCGVCVERCPIYVNDVYNEGLTSRKAIYLDYPQAVPNVYTIDPDACVGCRLCENVCMLKAIDFNQQPTEETIEVGAIILAPGFERFDARKKPEYGFRRFANVVTSVEFERILNAAGPYGGKLLRPADGKLQKRIAFIQCVGSRDANHNYCSAVCCSYAVKEALVAKEHQPDVEPVIFYADLRTFGKGFEEYYHRAEKEGVRFVRSMVAGVEEDKKTKNLFIKYETEDGKINKEEFDLVVLSVGLEISDNARLLAERVGVELDPTYFCKTGDGPLSTQKPGIFVAGAFSGPKDIPESITQASGAAVLAGALLKEARGTLVRKKEYPKEKDVTREQPRIGVFICHCGINIAGVVKVAEVREYAKTLLNVVYATDNLYTCSSDTQEQIKKAIKEYDLNRVIVASCTPRTHEPLFQETIREAGLNRYLFDLANIRDQCSWVHKQAHEEATEKAKDLVRMSVARSNLLAPLEEFTLAAKRSALVLGGGLAGMTASLALANQGFEVSLVEREKELGGNMRRIEFQLDGSPMKSKLENLVGQVREHSFIKIYPETRLTGLTGYVGNFKATIKSNENAWEIPAGAIVVATGGEEYKPKEYRYEDDLRVVTQQEWEGMVARADPAIGDLKTVVMIQCVGSRDEQHPYCSRLCCQQAVKNALKTKAMNPKTDVYILYKDVRTYGLSEKYYTAARQSGVVFVRYDDDHKPALGIDAAGRLELEVTDPLLGERLAINPDFVVLSAGVEPSSNKDLAKLLKVPLTTDGFFLEAHVKLRPVDFATDGIFLCGLAHSPRTSDEAEAQALAAAARASMILARGEWRVEPIISRVDPERCIGCGLCVSVCPYSALELKLVEGGRKAETISASCKGCGVCGASCPQHAITLQHFTDEEICAQIDSVYIK